MVMISIAAQNILIYFTGFESRICGEKNIYNKIFLNPALQTPNSQRSCNNILYVSIVVIIGGASV